jgi:hypothetical protein
MMVSFCFDDCNRHVILDGIFLEGKSMLDPREPWYVSGPTAAEELFWEDLDCWWEPEFPDEDDAEARTL